jgi:hypothetical protein
LDQTGPIRDHEFFNSSIAVCKNEGEGLNKLKETNPACQEVDEEEIIYKDVSEQA